MAEAHQEKRSAKGFSRRTFFRLIGGAGAGLLLFGGYRRRQKRQAPAPSAKVTVLPACVACTGCVSLCPTHAIFVAPEGIGVTDRDCIRCGYCAAACPVQGLRVNRESGHA